MLADSTQGGARATRQSKYLGTLEVGKKADILVLDTQRMHPVPAMRIVSAWIHNGQPSEPLQLQFRSGLTRSDDLAE
jgi:5-methylthioadenosine/S-adenosylhomocysteine deaminase